MQAQVAASRRSLQAGGLGRCASWAIRLYYAAVNCAESRQRYVTPHSPIAERQLSIEASARAARAFATSVQQMLPRTTAKAAMRIFLGDMTVVTDGVDKTSRIQIFNRLIVVSFTRVHGRARMAPGKGRRPPSLETPFRYAEALGCQQEIKRIRRRNKARKSTARPGAHASRVTGL